ncbi:thioredoxin fold domain-containing protein [uncultured Marivita sp.]|uniref:thioredoxin fold domain-containing protein n=1 Tax=uncultured Marivita sp. TaxID=888080 RepID=UPI0026398B15|nr:thioredoxin fold domain-containing protein [uncultured Marivita sp.]
MALATAFLASPAWLGSASAEPQLVMVEQPGCVYCERWDAEIAPAYPKTAEGQFAPLVRADLRAGPPDGVTYARRVVFTPTFVLIDEGEELARIEGYPGEDFFWPLLTKLLEENTEFSSATDTETVRN